MIRAEGRNTGRRPAINPIRGEFEVLIGGELIRFDTRLSTIAAIETACGDRAIVTVLNGIIAGRRARDVSPLLTAALSTVVTPVTDPAMSAEGASVGEAEAFILALIFALGFSVDRAGEGGQAPPLLPTATGGPGAGSHLAA